MMESLTIRTAAPRHASATTTEPPVIELFGPPGAGKTTLANTLIERTGCAGRRQPEVAWKRLSTDARLRLLGRAASDVGCLGEAMRMPVRLGLWNPESLVRLFRVVLKTAWLQQLPRPVVLDQGFLQDIWSILWASRCFAPEPARLAPLLHRMYRGTPVQILYLSLDPATAARRIAMRPGGRSRLDGVGEGEAAGRLDAAADLPGRIAAAARLAGLAVVELDARASPAHLVETVVHGWVGNRLAPAR